MIEYADKSTATKDLQAAAAALDLGYRLTAAVNIINNRLESWRWLVDWYNAIRASTQEFILATEPLRMGEERTQLSTKYIINAYTGMAHDALWLGRGAVNDGDCAVLKEAKRMLNKIHTTIGKAIDLSQDRQQRGNNDLMICWLLGEQLALDDMAKFSIFGSDTRRKYTHSADYGKHRKEVDVYKEFKESAFREYITPFIVDVDDYLVNRGRFRSHGKMFTQGGLICLLKAVWHPKLYPSVVWVLPSLDNKGYHLLCAGRCFEHSSIVHLKNRLDFSLHQLLYAMATDKAEGKQPARCGWVLRKSLYKGAKQDTMSKAWKVIERLADPIGGLEFLKKNVRATAVHPFREHGRVAGRLAEPDCLIICDEHGKS